MIIVLKLSTGVDYVCSINASANEFSLASLPEHVEVLDPMSIERDVDGMKLRDVLMLSEDDRLIINAKDIISYYHPSKQLVNYYVKALVYSKNFTKPSAFQQIELAVQDIEAAMQEEDENAKRLSRLLMRQAGSTLQ